MVQGQNTQKPASFVWNLPVFEYCHDAHVLEVLALLMRRIFSTKCRFPEIITVLFGGLKRIA